MGSNNSVEAPEFVTKTEILKILECPVCIEVPFPPIYMCLRGHSICKNCKTKLLECPLCKEKFTDSRNYVMEEIILTSFHECYYKADGCKIFEKGEYIQNHIKNCQYRPGKCVYYALDDCRINSIKLSEIKQHLILTHKSKVSERNEILYCVNEKNIYKNDSWASSDYHILEFDGKNFIINLINKDLIFYWIILLIGTEEEAQLYNVEIALKPNKGLKINWTIPINSISNRTVECFAFEEDEIFKPCCRWIDLKLIGVIDSENSDVINITATYKFSKN